ncbi:MAG: YIP1 family protein [Gemmatimonadota bacterium]
MRACHHCGFEFAAAADECPLCQTPASKTEPSRANSERADKVAWEDASEGFPGNLLQTWLDCVTRPTEFFSKVDLSASLGRPVLYYLIVSMLSAFFYMAWGSPGFDESWSSALGVQADQLGPISSSFKLLYFFATPFASLLALCIGTLAYHVFRLFLAPNGRRLSDTARVLCYAGSPGILNVIPWVGGLVGGIWSLVLLVVGIREMHRTTTGRSVAIVLLPMVILMVVAVLFTLLLVFMLAGVPDGFSR